MAGEFVALQAKLSRVAEALGKEGMKHALTQVGIAAKKDMDIEAVAAVGADAKFSGWKKIGKLTSGFDIVDTSVVIKPRPSGGWIVAEDGRKATTAPKRRKRAILNTPFGPRTYTKQHPLRIGRTRGKQALTKATNRIQQHAPEIYEAALQKELREAFDG